MEPKKKSGKREPKDHAVRSVGAEAIFFEPIENGKSEDVMRKQFLRIILGVALSLLQTGCAFKECLTEKLVEKCYEIGSNPLTPEDKADIEKLLFRGARMEGTEEYSSPLEIAVLMGNDDLLEYLWSCHAPLPDSHILKYARTARSMNILVNNMGANPNIKDLRGRSQIHYHAADPSSKALKTLLTRTDCNAADHRGYTPLHLACRHAGLGHVTLLIEYNAKVNAASYRGYTPLHMAVGRQDADLEVLAVLLNHGAEVNAADVDGNTALHMAKWYDQEKAIEFLLRHGADGSIKNKAGNTYQDAPMPKAGYFGLF
jgi:hypothetical protein